MAKYIIALWGMWYQEESKFVAEAVKCKLQSSSINGFTDNICMYNNKKIYISTELSEDLPKDINENILDKDKDYAFIIAVTLSKGKTVDDLYKLKDYDILWMSPFNIEKNNENTRNVLIDASADFIIKTIDKLCEEEKNNSLTSHSSK